MYDLNLYDLNFVVSSQPILVLCDVYWELLLFDIFMSAEFAATNTLFYIFACSIR